LGFVTSPYTPAFSGDFDPLPVSQILKEFRIYYQCAERRHEFDCFIMEVQKSGMRVIKYHAKYLSVSWISSIKTLQLRQFLETFKHSTAITCWNLLGIIGQLTAPDFLKLWLSTQHAGNPEDARSGDEEAGERVQVETGADDDEKRGPEQGFVE